MTASRRRASGAKSARLHNATSSTVGIVFHSQLWRSNVRSAFRARAHARARHLNSPRLEERLNYLRHCAEQSYKVRALRERAQTLLRIDKLLKLATSSNAIAPATIELSVSRAFRSRISDACRKHIVSVATEWLDFMKRLRPPALAAPVYESLQQDLSIT